MPEHVLMSEIEIIADGGRRRRWSSAEKLRIVEKTLERRESISVVAGRNRVAPTPLPDAETVLGLIAGWFKDDNENHPHSGLKMRWPRDFIAVQTATA